MMYFSTVQFITWTLVVFVGGMVAGIGAVSVWAFRAMCSADVQDMISGGQ
jgi:hypothetical protein